MYSLPDTIKDLTCRKNSNVDIGYDDIVEMSQFLILQRIHSITLSSMYSVFCEFRNITWKNVSGIHTLLVSVMVRYLILPENTS